MSNHKITSLAETLRKASTSCEMVDPIRTELPEMDVAAAYAVQHVNTEHALAQGRRLVGRKAGLTAKTVQKQLGVDQPDFGMLFADMAVDENDTIPISRLIQPKIEAEIAFVLERDLTLEQPTMADLLGAISYALPALEIVDSRIRDWDIGIVDTIADNASCGLFVLGTDPVSIKGLDLRLCGMTLECNEQTVSSGAGAACLGNPLNAVKWLASTMANVGRPLLAGDIILSGALGPMIKASAGQFFEARISGLGSVRTRFES
jgi:2-keto-4-pentenoate hydratase